MFNRLLLPAYNEIRRFEGKGNYAIDKYYKLPYSIFYRHKLKMIVNLMEDKMYKNCFDYGSGPGIFTPELKKHASSVLSHDIHNPVDSRWNFDLIVCASVLEFCHLNTTLDFLYKVCRHNGTLLVASPMNTKISNAYFKSIKDDNIRYSHHQIITAVSKKFEIEKIDYWMGLYFALRARKK